MDKKLIDRTREVHVEIRDSSVGWAKMPVPIDQVGSFESYVHSLERIFGEDNIRVVQTVLTTYVVTKGWERTGDDKKRGEHG